MEKPYETLSEVTYEMITTHPYFKTLSRSDLQEVVEYMNFDGYMKLKGSFSSGKLEILYDLFHPTITYPRLMLVSDDNKNWRKRVVQFERSIRDINYYFAWNDAETLEDSLEQTRLVDWKFAKEIEPEQPKVIELTLEEIAEKFGVEVNNLKIKK